MGKQDLFRKQGLSHLSEYNYGNIILRQNVTNIKLNGAFIYNRRRTIL